MLSHVVARALQDVLVGSDLSRNDEWLEICIRVSQDMHSATAAVREKYPAFLRWFAPYLNPDARAMLRLRERAREILRPVYKDAFVNAGSKSEHSVQWLLDASVNDKPSLDQVTDDQLLLSIAAVHTTATSLYFAVLDLVKNSKWQQKIMKDVNKSSAQDSQILDATAIPNIRSLDIFIDESQRLHPINLSTLTIYTLLLISQCGNAKMRTTNV